MPIMKAKKAGDGDHPVQGPIAVAVITPSGTFPNDDDYRRSFEGEIDRQEHLERGEASIFT